MDKLTIEEKAKAYDFSLKRAKRLYEQGTITESLSYVFPQLKKLGDGEVRKEIMQLIQGMHDADPRKERWLAWLEKQGQVNETIISQHEDKICKENNDSLTSEDERIRKDIKQHFLYLDDSFPDKAKWLAWLEKQGETFTKKDVDDAWLKGMCDAKHELEKQGEQKPADKVEPKDYNSIDPHFGKPADKVEPKFKVGEWITDGQLTCKVLSVTGKSYELHLYNDDYCHFETDVQSVDKHYHLWTIQDTHDGDVLTSIGFHSNCTFILKGLDNWKFDEPNGDRAVATGYCCLSVSSDKMEFGIQGPDCVEVNTVKPASKIQRELLFKKMKEAGYEWDTEKKELKKISQRIISAEAKEAMYGKPTAWSEEDERIFRTIISDGIRGVEFDMLQINWLKSLKQRIGG